MVLKRIKLKKKIKKQNKHQLKKTNKRKKSLNNNQNKMIKCKATIMKVKLTCKMMKLMNNSMLNKMMSDVYKLRINKYQ